MGYLFSHNSFKEELARTNNIVIYLRKNRSLKKKQKKKHEILFNLSPSYLLKLNIIMVVNFVKLVCLKNNLDFQATKF